MPFDNAKFRGVAINADVAGVALSTSIALRTQADALEKISKATNVDISDELAEIREKQKILWDEFVRLTGWEAADE